MEPQQVELQDAEQIHVTLAAASDKGEGHVATMVQELEARARPIRELPMNIAKEQEPAEELSVVEPAEEQEPAEDQVEQRAAEGDRRD